MVPKKQSVARIKQVIQERLHLTSDQALYLFSNGKSLSLSRYWSNYRPRNGRAVQKIERSRWSDSLPYLQLHSELWSYFSGLKTRPAEVESRRLLSDLEWLSTFTHQNSNKRPCSRTFKRLLGNFKSSSTSHKKLLPGKASRFMGLPRKKEAVGLLKTKYIILEFLPILKLEGWVLVDGNIRQQGTEKGWMLCMSRET